MNKKLYNLMDWAAIEEIVYGEAAHPERLLGAHKAASNTVIQAFFPGASKVSIAFKNTVNKDSNKKEDKLSDVKMEEVDENGYFAALVPGKTIPEYSYKVTYESESGKAINKTFEEVYSNVNILSKDDIKNFSEGKLEKADNLLGAHLTTINSKKGCLFAVYAPNALRVSVIGEFNSNNSLTHQMIKDDASGIFYIFIPGVMEGCEYNYEILVKGYDKYIKNDPYAKAYSKDLSKTVVTAEAKYSWNDDAYIKARNSNKKTNNPISIYEVNIATICEDGFVSLKAASDKIKKHVKAMNYTHVELSPLFEYVKDASSGYDASSYFSLTNRYGSLKDYQEFVDELHAAGIAVILQLPIASFANLKNEYSSLSLEGFDGSPVYEYDNENRKYDGFSGRLFFNYAKPEVYSFLASSVNYIIDILHLDAVKILDLASMLYLDYYKNNGEKNINGSNEHLEAIEFIKKINKLIHSKKGVFSIADNQSDFPNVTNINEDSLGFDYTSNFTLRNNLVKYTTLSPDSRSYNYGLLKEMIASEKKENYINTISHYDVDGIKGGMISKMFGGIQDKFSMLRSFYAMEYFLPGNKSIIAGQDIAEFDSISADRNVQWNLLDFDNHKKFKDYIKNLNNLFIKNAIYNSSNFEWLNNDLADSNVIAYTLATANKTMLVVANFSSESFERYKLGCKLKGKYKLVFSSDDEKFAGNTSLKDKKIYSSRLENCQSYDSTLRLSLPALTVNVYEFSAYTESEIKEMERKQAARVKKVEDRIKAVEKYKEDKIKIYNELNSALLDKVSIVKDSYIKKIKK